MAIQMYSALGVGNAARGANMSSDGVVSSYWTAIGLEVDLHHRARRREFPGDIRPVKPSWWDALYTPTKIRPGQTAGDSVLEDKAKRLKTWYLTTMRYGDTYMLGSGKVLEQALAEIKKEEPDATKMRAYARQTQEYLFMVQATVDLAQALMKLAE
jgi:hypothetical protein